MWHKGRGYRLRVTFWPVRRPLVGIITFPYVPEAILPIWISEYCMPIDCVNIHVICRIESVAFWIGLFEFGGVTWHYDNRAGLKIWERLQLVLWNLCLHLVLVPKLL